MPGNFPIKSCIYSKIECQQLTTLLKESSHFSFDVLSREFLKINMKTQKTWIPCFYSFYNILRDFLMHTVFGKNSDEKKRKKYVHFC